LAIEQDGVTDCVGGAKVTLSQNDRIVGEAVTDGFGDFKIDRVPPHSGRYSIAIAAPGRAPKTLECEIKDESVYLGTILV
jgi:hypothetical protein